MTGVADLTKMIQIRDLQVYQNLPTYSATVVVLGTVGSLGCIILGFDRMDSMIETVTIMKEISFFKGGDPAIDTLFVIKVAFT